MATFLTTIKFTEQGIKQIRDTCKRAEALKASAQKMGAKVTAVYWTPGVFDGLMIFDAPDVDTASAFMLHVASLGFVHTQMTRAYTAPEMEKVLAAIGR